MSAEEFGRWQRELAVEYAREHVTAGNWTAGEGLDRALLAAGERAARERGARALELNVFGANETAAQLYRTSGYRVVTQQMRKDLVA
ncbi:GNAT family N-acetyltransferase [Micromonospora sp. NPDC050980]|uniref:GNAT family N-acetyltransferase n=1 Tax=Micromonospora sp. NPDC050980 TaxID=3155161 RepID=UPI0033C1BBFB